MRLWVWSLASLSGLRIWLCCDLWCRMQMWLGSHVAVALARLVATAPIRPLCHGCDPRKGQKKKKKRIRGVPAVVQWVKDLSFFLRWLGSLLFFWFDPWPGNFHIQSVQPKKKKKGIIFWTHLLTYLSFNFLSHETVRVDKLGDFKVILSPGSTSINVFILQVLIFKNIAKYVTKAGL